MSKEIKSEENVANPWQGDNPETKPSKPNKTEKPAKPAEKTAKSTKPEKIEKPEKPTKAKPKEKAKQKRNGKPKINAYGFIHLSAEVYEKLGLPKKTDIPIDLKIDAEARTILVKILK